MIRRESLQREYFLFLLPLFFVLHGFVENFPAVPAGGALLLLLKYLAGTALLSGIFYLVYKDFRKTSLFVFLLLLIYFFFGAFQDLLKKYFAESFVTKYSFLLPLLIMVAAFSFLLIKKSRFAHNRKVRFLNILLLALIAVELVLLAPKLFARNDNHAPLNLPVCKSCPKPDIFLIIADEYSGSKALLKNFGFDNSAFESQLRQRGFFIVPGSRSNYNFTVYSVASLLQMDYLKNVNLKEADKPSLTRAYAVINRNTTLEVLKAHDYEIKNFSYFTVDNQPALTTQSKLTNKEALISGQTLFSRVFRDLGFHLVTTLKLKSVERWFTYVDYHNNRLLLKKFREEIKTKSALPRFVYTHVMLPHYPYYQNKNGELNPLDSVKEGTQGNMRLYLDYLQYANKIYLGLIDEILKQSSRPAVILFMSDHGFREYPAGVPNDDEFLTVNAVYGLRPEGFYPGMSNVNQFRNLMNQVFRQRLPLLKDSSIFLEKF